MPCQTPKLGVAAGYQYSLPFKVDHHALMRRSGLRAFECA